MFENALRAHVRIDVEAWRVREKVRHPVSAVTGMDRCGHGGGCVTCRARSFSFGSFSLEIRVVASICHKAKEFLTEAWWILACRGTSGA